MEISEVNLNKLVESFRNFKDFADMTEDSIADLKNNLEILKDSVGDILDALEQIAKQV